jgi:hypothetical protein
VKCLKAAGEVWATTQHWMLVSIQAGFQKQCKMNSSSVVFAGDEQALPLSPINMADYFCVLPILLLHDEEAAKTLYKKH